MTFKRASPLCRAETIPCDRKKIISPAKRASPPHVITPLETIVRNFPYHSLHFFFFFVSYSDIIEQWIRAKYERQEFKKNAEDKERKSPYCSGEYCFSRSHVWRRVKVNHLRNIKRQFALLHSYFLLSFSA